MTCRNLNSRIQSTGTDQSTECPTRSPPSSEAHNLRMHSATLGGWREDVQREESEGRITVVGCSGETSSLDHGLYFSLRLPPPRSSLPQALPRSSLPP
eukprot:2352409-Rhodomonas_salina.1